MKNKNAIQFLARNFMRRMGPCFPVNLQRIAQLLNSHICYRDDMPRTVNGTTIPLRDGGYIIAIKSFQPFFNERFSLAREIAHIALGHCAEGIVVTSSPELHDAGIFRHDLESYAFALEMLVPLEALMYSLSSHDFLDIDKLGTLYGVEGEIIKTRLDEIGLIPHNLPHTLSLSSCCTQGRIV